MNWLYETLDRCFTLYALALCLVVGHIGGLSFDWDRFEHLGRFFANMIALGPENEPEPPAESEQEGDNPTPAD